MSERPVKFPVFLANVQALMDEKCWDQSVLAEAVDTTQSSVSRWGWSSAPRGPTLAKLAEIAGVSPTEMLDVPLKTARKSRSAGLPSGKRLIETMAALLDNAGLPHLVDEYAPKLARLLPGLLADSVAPLDDQASSATKLGGARPQGRATDGHGKQR